MSQQWPGPYAPGPYLPPPPNTSTSGPKVITFIGIGCLVVAIAIVVAMVWAFSAFASNVDTEVYWWFGLSGAAFLIPVVILLGIAGLGMTAGGAIMWGIRAQARSAYGAQPQQDWQQQDWQQQGPPPGSYPPV